jgi:hypothetical protein
MTARSTHHRIGRVVAVVVAGTVFGIGGTLAMASAPSAQLTPQQQNAQFAALAEWAKAQHLTGLSPASLGAQNRNLKAGACRSNETSIAEFAAIEGLSGLSPASLHRIGN